MTAHNVFNVHKHKGNATLANAKMKTFCSPHYDNDNRQAVVKESLKQREREREKEACSCEEKHNFLFVTESRSRLKLGSDVFQLQVIWNMN